jgi:hypothetical protein
MCKSPCQPPWIDDLSIQSITQHDDTEDKKHKKDIVYDRPIARMFFIHLLFLSLQISIAQATVTYK